MTIDEQLREIARHADEHQGVITVDEIVRRAARRDSSLAEPSDGSRPIRTGDSDRLASERHRGRRRLLVAAAAIVVAALGLLAVEARNDPDRVDTDTITPAPLVGIRPGSIAFAADSNAGDALSPLSYGSVDSGPEQMDIYVTRGGEPTRRLIAGSAHERCPSFSPDRQRFAYLEASADGGGPAPSIVVVPLSSAGEPGAPAVRIALPASNVYEVKLDIGVPCPQWSPDGSRLAYLAYAGYDPDTSTTPDVAELRVATPDGRETVVNPGRLANLEAPFAWSPDGEALAFVTADGVWTAPLDGGPPTLGWSPDGTPTAVSWSSHGELAVTVLTTTPVEGGFEDDRSVHVIDVAGGSRPVGAIHVYDYAADWSPDGSQLAFVGDDGQVRLNDRDDGSMVTLSPRLEDVNGLTFWDVAWSPDGGQLLAFARSDERGFALVSMSTDGAEADVLTPWSWALDWINLEDVSWHPTTG